MLDKKLYLDPKSYFQEQAQAHTGITPHYQSVAEAGPDHERVFTAAVLLGEEEVARGSGKSKQEAQRNAAKKALEMRGWL